MTTLDVVMQNDASGELPLILDRHGKPIPCNETEERIDRLAQGLARVDGVRFHAPDVSEVDARSAVEELHSAEYLAFLERTSASLADDEMLLFDHPHVPHGIAPDTPIVAGIYRTACRSARTAISAARRASAQPASTARRAPLVYALCRPPGHHAGRAYLGGHCYLNNAVLAVATLERHGHERVALIDFDIHFGNGSSDLLHTMPGTFFGSIHASTDNSYPYIPTPEPDGRQLFIPFSTPPSHAEFVDAVDRLLHAARQFGITALVVSAGYDVIEGDPHGAWHLEPPALFDIGGLIAETGFPTCIVQEGGYNVERLADCAEAFARGVLAGAGTTARGHTRVRTRADAYSTD